MESNKYFDTIKSLKFLAQKELGQNFLVDSAVCQAIIDSIDIRTTDNVLEIGCGFGSLSYFLLKKANQCTLIDVDQKMVDFVKENNNLSAHQNVINCNIFKMNLDGYTKVVGNLPYYITTSILEKVLLESSEKLIKCIFMIQKDVYPRLVAKPNEDDYGPLSILISYIGSTEKILSVSCHSFVPQPHVDSLVFSLNLINHDGFRADLYETCKKLFLYRRKTIYNNLKALTNNQEKAHEILKICSISENSRPEQLSLNDFVAVTKQLHNTYK